MAPKTLKNLVRGAVAPLLLISVGAAAPASSVRGDAGGAPAAAACKAAAETLADIGMTGPDKFALRTVPQLREDYHLFFSSDLWSGRAPDAELRGRWGTARQVAVGACNSVRTLFADRLAPAASQHHTPVDLKHPSPRVWSATLPVLNRRGDLGVYLVERQSPFPGAYLGLVMIAKTPDGWRVVGRRSIVTS
jgi:hypothetical protein